MSLIKILLVVGMIAATIVEAPVIWKKQSAETRKRVVSWVPKGLLLDDTKSNEEIKKNEQKVVEVSKQKPKVYRSEGHHGEIEFSDGRSITATSHVRLISNAKGVTHLYQCA